MAGWPRDPIDQELQARLGEDWRSTIPAGAVLATVSLTGHAVHDVHAEVGRAVGWGRTRSDPWGDFSSGRWLWFLTITGYESEMTGERWLASWMMAQLAVTITWGVGW